MAVLLSEKGLPGVYRSFSVGMTTFKMQYSQRKTQVCCHCTLRANNSSGLLPGLVSHSLLFYTAFGHLTHQKYFLEAEKLMQIPLSKGPNAGIFNKKYALFIVKRETRNSIWLFSIDAISGSTHNFIILLKSCFKYLNMVPKIHK